MAFSVQNMDASVAPGQDFYKYAAGGWYARTPIPSDKARWGAIMELAEINIGRLKVIAEEAAHEVMAGAGLCDEEDVFASIVPATAPSPCAPR